MDWPELSAKIGTRHLTAVGGFQATNDDALPDGTKTVILLGPQEPGFWHQVTQAPEWSDGQADPLDRWSRRVIDRLADVFGAHAIYPFGGPPHWPFLSWAVRTGQIWPSPVGLLVHHEQGLWVSFRGALALPFAVDLGRGRTAPCETCSDQPCRAACPVGALTPDGYDVPACKTFIAAEAGTDCKIQGCVVRRACPVSQAWSRSPEQSAFHMDAFLT